jgi:hypothetical protein
MRKAISPEEAAELRSLYAELPKTQRRAAGAIRTYRPTYEHPAKGPAEWVEAEREEARAAD